MLEFSIIIDNTSRLPPASCVTSSCVAAFDYVIYEIAFDYVIYEIVNNSVEGSKISIYISLPNSPHEKPIWSRLRPVSEINAELILSLISSINQSISPIPVENYFSYPYGSKRIKFQV